MLLPTHCPQIATARAQVPKDTKVEVAEIGTVEMELETKWVILRQSHVQGFEVVSKKVVEQDRIRKELNNFLMNGTLFHMLIGLSPLRDQNFTLRQVMVDCGCSSYRIINPAYTTKCNFKWLQTCPIYISTFKGNSQQGTISEVTYGVMQIKSHVQPHIFFFVAELHK